MAIDGKVFTYGKKVGLAFLGYYLSDRVGKNVMTSVNPNLVLIGKGIAGIGIGVFAPNNDLKSLGVGIGIDAVTDTAMMVMNKGSGSSSDVATLQGISVN